MGGADEKCDNESRFLCTILAKMSSGTLTPFGRTRICAADESAPTGWRAARTAPPGAFGRYLRAARAKSFFTSSTAAFNDRENSDNDSYWCDKLDISLMISSILKKT
jgi:hypothetical protein